MFITTNSRINPHSKEILPKYWSYLGRSSATKELGKQDIMITYRKTSPLKDMPVSHKLPNPEPLPLRAAIDPTPAILCQNLPIRENQKLGITINPILQSLMALAKATI